MASLFPLGRARIADAMTAVGVVMMLVGAIDPIAAAPWLVTGAGLSALGGYWRPDPPPAGLRVRLVAWVLLAIGATAFWWLRHHGGLGGRSGRSLWWALVLLPYPAGWFLAVWAPGLPRWTALGGMLLGSFYLGLAVVVGVQSRRLAGAAVLLPLGAVIFTGSLLRWRRGRAPRSATGALPPSQRASS